MDNFVINSWEDDICLFREMYYFVMFEEFTW